MTLCSDGALQTDHDIWENWAAGFGEPRLLTCSRARPQPLVRRAPAGAQSPARSCRAPRARPQPLVRRAPARVRILRASPCSPGTSPALGSASPDVRVFCPRLRRCSCLRLLPVRRHVSADAAASARCLCAATPLPLQLPPLAARAPPLLRSCSCLRTVFCSLRSARCVFCAALCVAISLRCVRFPQFAICTLCSVTCAVPSGSCQPG